MPEIAVPGFVYVPAAGTCEKLVDGRCSVYETRPLICNIDKMITHLGIDREQSYRETAQVCNQLIDEDGLDEDFKIYLEWK